MERTTRGPAEGRRGPTTTSAQGRLLGRPGPTDPPSCPPARPTRPDPPDPPPGEAEGSEAEGVDKCRGESKGGAWPFPPPDMFPARRARRRGGPRGPGLGGRRRGPRSQTQVVPLRPRFCSPPLPCAPPKVRGGRGGMRSICWAPTSRVGARGGPRAEPEKCRSTSKGDPRRRIRDPGR